MANAVRITASEFRQNFGTYMKNVATTDYEVTRNGRVIGLWTDPHRDNMAAFHRLAGSITVPEDERNIDTTELVKRARRERLEKKLGYRLPNESGDGR